MAGGVIRCGDENENDDSSWRRRGAVSGGAQRGCHGRSQRVRPAAAAGQPALAERGDDMIELGGTVSGLALMLGVRILLLGRHCRQSGGGQLDLHNTSRCRRDHANVWSGLQSIAGA